MIDWVVVLAALCAGLAVLIGLSARQETQAHPTTRLFMWLVPGAALLVALAGAGLSVWQTMSSRADLSASRAASLPGGVGPEAAATVWPTATAAPTLQAASAAVQTIAPDGGRAPEASPARLQIPSLGLDEVVLHIPLRAGAWDITGLGLGIGWLESTGAQPLTDLSMVFIGHLTLSATQRGPFAELQHIARGAEVIYVHAGEAFVYTVREKGRMTTDAVERVYRPDGRSLLLVTCTDWDFDSNEYAKRLLVRAELTERRLAPASAAGQPAHQP